MSESRMSISTSGSLGLKRVAIAMKAICRGRRCRIEIGDQLYHTDDRIGGYSYSNCCQKEGISSSSIAISAPKPVAERDQLLLQP